MCLGSDVRPTFRKSVRGGTRLCGLLCNRFSIRWRSDINIYRCIVTFSSIPKSISAGATNGSTLRDRVVYPRLSILFLLGDFGDHQLPARLVGNQRSRIRRR